MSSRRLLGAHPPPASPQRRETVSGECLGCLTRFAIDVRLPLPARCPDCGADVLALADIEAPGTQPRLPFGPPRIRGEAMTGCRPRRFAAAAAAVVIDVEARRSAQFDRER